MKCKICEKSVQAKLCETCQEVMEWMYPDQDVNEIVEKYDELDDLQKYLRRGKRK